MAQWYRVARRCWPGAMLREIARMLDVTRQRAVQVVGSYADFPTPVATLASGRIWERDAVEAWITAHPDRKPGRRPKRSEAGATEAYETGQG
jgi:prophage regulatory protein